MSRTVAKYGLQPDTVISQSGKGGFFGGGLGFFSTNTTDVMSGSANQVRAVQFVLPIQATISKVSVNVTTLAAASVGDVGLYDLNGNRLAFTNGGIDTTGTGVKTVNLSGGAVTLAPGVYYYAYCNSSSTPVCTAFATATIGSPLLLNRHGNAANAASSGVLPATLGAITNVGINVIAGWFEP